MIGPCIEMNSFENSKKKPTSAATLLVAEGEISSQLIIKGNLLGAGIMDFQFEGKIRATGNYVIYRLNEMNYFVSNEEGTQCERRRWGTCTSYPFNWWRVSTMSSSCSTSVRWRRPVTSLVIKGHFGCGHGTLKSGSSV